MACKIFKHVRTTKEALKYNLDDVVEGTVGTNIQAWLFVVPVWVIFAWIIGQPFSLRFDLSKTALLGIASYIPAKILEDSRTKWLDGAALVTAYVVSTLGLHLSR